MAYRKFYAEFSSDKTAEKTIILATLSAIIAIFLDGKKKKPSKRKNFIQRTAKNYKLANNGLTAYSVHIKKKQIVKEQGIRLEKSEPIDITL
jgi:hypothetical protein